MKKSRQTVYLACEELDFVWDIRDISQVIQLWNSGNHIYEIAEEVQRETDEVAILLIDLRRKGKVRTRESGDLVGRVM